jgi:transglutaminase-like putative cysteine protease
MGNEKRQHAAGDAGRLTIGAARAVRHPVARHATIARHTERRALARSLCPILRLHEESADAIAYLNGAAARDASRPEILALARRIRSAYSGDEAFARAVQTLVKASVSFVREARETFQHARQTLRRRAGDCDDHARAVVALARAGGGKGRLIGFPNARGILEHVAPLLWDGRRFRWAETTMDARFGEFPSAAARRLGVERAGLWAERRGLMRGSLVMMARSVARP